MALLRRAPGKLLEAFADAQATFKEYMIMSLSIRSSLNAGTPFSDQVKADRDTTTGDLPMTDEAYPQVSGTHSCLPFPLTQPSQ